MNEYGRLSRTTRRDAGRYVKLSATICEMPKQIGATTQHIKMPYTENIRTQTKMMIPSLLYLRSIGFITYSSIASTKNNAEIT